MTTPLHFAAFVMNTTSPHPPRACGAARRRAGRLQQSRPLGRPREDPRARRSSTRSSSPTSSGSTATTDARPRATSREGLQIPSNDPSVLAAHRLRHRAPRHRVHRRVLQEHPFNFARRISTLDHASKGRIAWNIVTNYLDNASRNFGLDGLTDARRALRLGRRVRRRRLQAVGGLLGGRRAGPGPRDAASTPTRQDPQDQPRGPSATTVEGPHLRQPVAAAHAAAVPGRRLRGGPHVRRPQRRGGLHRRADAERAPPASRRHPAPAPSRHGRRAERHQVLPGPALRRRLAPRRRRRRKAAELERVGSTTTGYSRTCRARSASTSATRTRRHAGRRARQNTEGVQSIVGWIKDLVTDRDRRRCATSPRYTLAQHPHRRHARADRRRSSQRWRAAGVDGINVVNAEIPGSYEEFVDHVLPGAARARPGPARSTPRARCARSCSAAATASPSATRPPATAAPSRRWPSGSAGRDARSG